MKFILDFFPILLFFGAYKMADIYSATAVLMGATVVQTAILYKMEGKLQTMQKITLVLILGFGALTLACMTSASSNGSPPCSIRVWPSR